MNKKGFVFLETIIILVLVTLSLTTMLSSYTLITSKSREKEFYDMYCNVKKYRLAEDSGS